MMKKVLFPALIAFAAIGCSKSDGGADPVPEQGTPFSIGCYVGPEKSTESTGTRTTYDGAAPTTMLWSSYDNIGVYSFNASGAAIAKDNCSILEQSIGKVAGYFKPDNLGYVEQWIGENTGAVTFRSYYPVEQAAIPAYGEKGIAVSVPEVQNGGFGHYQICCATTETTTEALETKPSVEFAFKPVSSMVRLFFYLVDESDVDEAIISEASFSTFSTGLLSGACTLDIAGGKLITTPSATKVESKVAATMTQAIRVAKLPASLKGKETWTSADFAAYTKYVTPVDIVTLPLAAADNATLSFHAVTSGGLKLTAGNIYAAKGILGGSYYNALCPLSIKVDNSTPDGSYVDGGAAWGSDEETDGAYMDNGTAW